MPEIGDIKRGQEIGKYPYMKYIWQACEGCGKERWVTFKKGEPINRLCYTCAAVKKRGEYIGEHSCHWKGGRRKNQRGYILIRLSADDFFYTMANKDGYVLEHRLVVAKKLGRCLQPWELVHHKGIRYTDIRNKSDNLEDNLEMTTRGSHTIEHTKGYRDGYAKGLIDGRDKRTAILEQRVTLLEAENVSLKQQLETAIEDTQLNIGDWNKPL